MLAFANNYLAGALITLLIPATVFVAITIWYVHSVLRMSSAQGEATPEVPSAPQPPSAGITATGERGGESGQTG